MCDRGGQSPQAFKASRNDLKFSKPELSKTTGPPQENHPEDGTGGTAEMVLRVVRDLPGCQVVTDEMVEEALMDHKVLLDQKVMSAKVERQALKDLLDPKGKRDKKGRGCLE